MFNPMFLSIGLELIKEIIGISQKIIEAGDSKKLAESVNEYNEGINKTFDLMRKIVEEDTSLSADEKLERLNRIAKEEAESKRKAAEDIITNRKAVTQISLSLIEGLLTCGISFTPKIIKGIKDAAKDDDNIVVIPETDTDNNEDDS